MYSKVHHYNIFVFIQNIFGWLTENLFVSLFILLWDQPIPPFSLFCSLSIFSCQESTSVCVIFLQSFVLAVWISIASCNKALCMFLQFTIFSTCKVSICRGVIRLFFAYSVVSLFNFRFLICSFFFLSIFF